ncbi:MAG: extracellular solute-binding protein [Rhodobacteraceae bacterium]|nr:extracellular solute-binding protein [Paracoccaceae bacterium]
MNRKRMAFKAIWVALSAVLLLASPGLAADDEMEIIQSHGISTFGDLKYAADFESLEYVNVDAPRGGEISMWAYGGFDSMNPYTRKGLAGSLSSIFFESLLEGTLDRVSDGYGLLAKSLRYPEDRSWVEFEMRPEATFSDGTPVTAEDVYFSYELFLTGGLQSFRVELEKAVASAEILGPHSIRFNFNTDRTTRDFPALVGGLPIFSKKWFEDTGSELDESRLEPAVGSGPYVLDSLDVNRQIVYRRNPDYWGYHLPINQGRHNFDTIRIEYFADTNSAFEAFKAGEYTFRSEFNSKQWATGYEFPAVEKGWVVRATPPDGSVASGQSFLFNLRREKFQDVRVREAIGLMFNFEWTNETLFYDLYKRINSFWENSYLEATELPGEAELELLNPLKDKLPPSVFTEPPVMAPVSTSRRLDREMLREASRLLDEAGWVVGDDGMRRNAEGNTLDVEFLSGTDSFARVINPYVENLKQLGVNARFNLIDAAQYTQRERDRDFDVITGSFRMGYEPGAGLRQYLGSEHVDGVFNDAGLANEAVDQLIDHVIDAETAEEIKVAVHALDRTLRSLKFWVPQWYRDFYTVAYYDIFEHPENLPPYGLGLLDIWWFDPVRAAELEQIGAF